VGLGVGVTTGAGVLTVMGVTIAVPEATGTGVTAVELAGAGLEALHAESVSAKSANSVFIVRSSTF